MQSFVLRACYRGNGTLFQIARWYKDLFPMPHQVTLLVKKKKKRKEKTRKEKTRKEKKKRLLNPNPTRGVVRNRVSNVHRSTVLTFGGLGYSKSGASADPRTPFHLHYTSRNPSIINHGGWHCSLEISPTLFFFFLPSISIPRILSLPNSGLLARQHINLQYIPSTTLIYSY